MFVHDYVLVTRWLSKINVLYFTSFRDFFSLNRMRPTAMLVSCVEKNYRIRNALESRKRENLQVNVNRYDKTENLTKSLYSIFFKHIFDRFFLLNRLYLTQRSCRQKKLWAEKIIRIWIYQVNEIYMFQLNKQNKVLISLTCHCIKILPKKYAIFKMWLWFLVNTFFLGYNFW